MKVAISISISISIIAAFTVLAGLLAVSILALSIASQANAVKDTDTEPKAGACVIGIKSPCNSQEFSGPGDKSDSNHSKHHHDIKQDTPRNSNQDIVAAPPNAAKPMNMTGYVFSLAQQCEQMPGGYKLPSDKLANLVNQSLNADNITPVLQTCGNYLPTETNNLELLARAEQGDSIAAGQFMNKFLETSNR